MSIQDGSIIKLPKILDNRGSLTFIQGIEIVPFQIKRVYYLYDFSKGSVRGGHAHKENFSLLIAISGSFKVILDNAHTKKIFKLSKPNEGLFIPPLIWRELSDFSENAICLALGSSNYEENEYIRSYSDFIKLKK